MEEVYEVVHGATTLGQPGRFVTPRVVRSPCQRGRVTGPVLDFGHADDPAGVAAAGGVTLLLTGVRVLQEYERAVVFRFGRARKALAAPGVNLLLPFGIDRMRVVDMRTRAIQIAPQEVITHDNISISVDAVVYASVASPSHAVLEVEEFMPATLQLAATTLRAVLGKMDLDEILAHRDAINGEVRTILDTRTEQWGVEISAVEIKDIQLPKEMQRAMARQAEAERERRAKVIAAEGEVQAASKLAQAAEMIAAHPGALQLRLYQTLVEVSGEASSTIVFPGPDRSRPDGAGGGIAGADPEHDAERGGAGDQPAGEKQLGAAADKLEAGGPDSRLTAGLPVADSEPSKGSAPPAMGFDGKAVYARRASSVESRPPRRRRRRPPGRRGAAC